MNTPLRWLCLTAVMAHGAGIAATLPADQYISLRVTTPGFTDRFVSHQGGTVGIRPVSTASTREQRMDATFLVVRGLADARCYSLEANFPRDHYLRHRNGHVELARRTGDAFPAVFDADATWCADDGNSGSGVSLRAFNAPSKYLRHADGKLLITDQTVNGWSFAADATWRITRATTDDAPVAYPVAGQSRGAGQLPVRLAKEEYLGEISSSRTLPRDVGFSGVIDGQIVWTFADSLRTDFTKSPPAPVFCSSNSAALGHFNDPLRITDHHVRSDGCPDEWVPFFGRQKAEGVSRWGNWITNLVEYAPNKGLIYYVSLLRNTPECSGLPGCNQGSGVAAVSMIDGRPVVSRTSETVWNGFEPSWGGVGAAFDARDGYVYVFGRSPDDRGNVYLARARPESATDASQYQYYDRAAQAWTHTRFTTDGRFGTIAMSDQQAVFIYNSADQTVPFWSNHFNAWMRVYGDHWSRTPIKVATAPRLEGPWIDAPFTVSTCPPGEDCTNDGKFYYAVTGHPEFDPSGKTVLVTWSTWRDNRIHARRLTWQ